ncbi:uncharacterized protein PV09_07496 [Verruconis gallopava]|uniref:J domain-containing protein n=1 Tax=Verruconis gallopava TaxID=253628 RepID=A0A0D2APC3_9PEZI|nr:uncharacterized protein PV09_07496 [Verruconis gallopava]KIW00974.1 hypothetical protein PV09_07496 [Verruconis gallopava]
MVKADPKRNYYADLEVSPSADIDEIKRQFRKLARLYHPDRNPGKEVEYVPKFQAIQAAHEILSDPDARAKYDADRRKLNAYASTRPNVPPRTSGQTNFNRSPYEAFSNFPPPRMRTQPKPTRERPQSFTTHSSTQPPPRQSAFPNFASPHNPGPRVPPRQTYAKDDADARRSAWEHIKHTSRHPQEQTWSDDDGLRKARAARDAATAHQSKPGLGRSSTVKGGQPRKTGFDPNARLSGDWEPQARSTSSYKAGYRTTPPRAPSPPPATAHAEKEKLRTEPLGSFRTKLNPDEVPFSEGARVRTPYASEGIGEKTYFNTGNLSRSSSMRDAPELAKQAARKGPSPRANAARHRSASPVSRNNVNSKSSPMSSSRRASAAPGSRRGTTFNLDYSSSSSSEVSEDDEDPDSDASVKQMSGSGAGATFKGRKTAQPSSFWRERTDSPLKGHPNGPFSRNGDPGSKTSGIPPIFSFSNIENGGNAQDHRRRSADNISTNFNASEWEGTFKGSNAFAPPPPPPRPTSGRGATTRRRASPTRRGSSKPAQARPGASSDNPIDLTSTQPGTQANPIDLEADAMPFPPPRFSMHFGATQDSSGIPPRSAGSSSQGGVSLGEQQQSGTGGPGTFRSEDWLRKPTFFFQPPTEAPRPPSPGKANTTTAKKTKATRPRKQSKGENHLRPPTHELSSDVEGEESEATGGKTSRGSGSPDGDAMEIDSDLASGAGTSTSPRTEREPRIVPVAPQRPEWREPAGAQPGVKPGVIPGMNTSAVPSAVPNAAVPGQAHPPPPPPPPQPAMSNTKQKRDSSLNFDSFHRAAPFAPTTSGNGLSSLKTDLSGTLPFESQPSPVHPGKPTLPRQLELPRVPKAPMPPSGSRISQTQWREYMSAMAFYMGAWYQFEDKILAHFNARHRNAAKFGTGILLTEGGVGGAADAMRLLEAGGEGSEEGYASYLRGMEEDIKVSKHWDVAKEKHRFAIETLLDFKKKIYLGQAQIIGNAQ